VPSGTLHADMVNTPKSAARGRGHPPYDLVAICSIQTTLSGPMDAMQLHATPPAGEINLTLSTWGPVMYNNGTGPMPFLDGTSYYYSLPTLAPQGTLTVNNRTCQVTGESWLDRQ